MKHILTLFDYSHKPPWPLISLVVDGVSRPKFHIFYLPKTGIKLGQIRENITQFKSLFDGPVLLNDMKSHIQAFDVDYSDDLYDMCLPRLKGGDNPKHYLVDIAKVVVRMKPAAWMRLAAQVSFVYQHLENRGVRVSLRRMHPRYSLETYTGRSKCLDFNVQGASEEYDIRPSDVDDFYFVHFDWVAADIRMASFMSGDKQMELSYRKSDPYTDLTEFLNDADFTRDKVKVEFLKSFYSLNFESPIFGPYPDFRREMIRRKEFLDLNGYSLSVLGRRFLFSKDKLSTFNAQFQGSVAHAMHASLVKIAGLYPDNLLTEMHDSIVLYCPRSSIPDVIEDVIDIMYDPLKGLCDPSPVMPVKVSIGRKWKRWKLLKVYR
jgi:hypothetical protein